jgi:hypothetical protein
MVPLQLMRMLREHSAISDRMMHDIDELRRIRNEVAHGASDHKAALTPNVVERANRAAMELERLAQETPPPS